MNSSNMWLNEQKKEKKGIFNTIKPKENLQILI